MTKEELISFLKDNLRIEVEVNKFSVKCYLYLGHNLISSSYDGFV